MSRLENGTRAFGLILASVGLACLAPAPGHAAVDGPKVAWNWASFGNPRPGSVAMDKFVEIVSAETNGNFSIKIAYGETLAPSKEIIDGIKIGAFEGGFWSPPFAPGKQLTASIFTLPFLPLGDLAQATRISDLYYRQPVPQKDFEAWSCVYLMPMMIPGYEFIGRGDPPMSLADWKGKRVRALGGQGQAMAKLGAVTTTVTSPEVYGALERGVIDAAALPYYAFVSFKLLEISKWYTKDLGLGYIISSVPLNKAAYEKLPPQYRKLLTDTAPIALAAHNKALAEDDEKTIAALKARGLREIAIPAAMRNDFVQLAAQPVWDEWVKDMASKGYPGRELLDFVLSESKKQGS